MEFVCGKGIYSLTCRREGVFLNHWGKDKASKERFSIWMHTNQLKNVFDRIAASFFSSTILFGHLERNSVVLRNRIILSYPFVWNGIVFHTGLDEMALSIHNGKKNITISFSQRTQRKMDSRDMIGRETYWIRETSVNIYFREFDVYSES